MPLNEGAVFLDGGRDRVEGHRGRVGVYDERDHVGLPFRIAERAFLRRDRCEGVFARGKGRPACRRSTPLRCRWPSLRHFRAFGFRAFVDVHHHFGVALAVPVKLGVRSFEGLVGAVRTTFGELVSTTNVSGLLWPTVFPSELGSVAIAVYFPLFSALERLAGPHLPLVTLAWTVCSGVPSAFEPSNTSTVTGSVSLAVPLNDGLVSLDGVSITLSVTSGGLVLITKVCASLLPGPLPIALSSSAIAV